MTPTYRTAARPWPLRSKRLLAVVASVGLLAAMIVGREVAFGGSSGNLASDTFSRTVRSGWGTAANGGAWNTSKGAPTFSVARGSARMVLTTNGSRPTATMPSVRSTSTDLLVTFRASKSPTGGGTYVYAIGRAVWRGGAYVAKAHLLRTGKVGLTLVRRTVKGSEVVLAREVVVSGLSSRAGSGFALRVQVFGTGTTAVRAKLWAAGRTEPASWRLTVRDTTPALQRAGTIGVAGFLAPRATNAPVVISFTRVVASTVRKTSAVVPATTTTTTTTTTSSATAGAGAATIGTTSYAVPSGAKFLATNGSDANAGTSSAPVATLARALAIVPAGGTIVVRGGSYTQGGVAITKAVTIQPYPGEAVWFDGSRVLTGFAASGAVWVAPYSYVFDHSPTYDKGAPDSTNADWRWVPAAYPMAAYPDMVWINGVEQKQVGALSSVTAGTFFVDTANHLVYVGTSPVGVTVKASALQQFGSINAGGVTLRGIGIRRYADSVPMMGALVVYGKGARLENVVIADNATQGLAIGTTGVRLSHLTATGNGLLGVQAVYADGLLLDHVVSRANDDEHFNPSPVSGGVKITRSRGITVRNSVVSNNVGRGLWVDESCYNVTLVNNDVIANTDAGVIMELSELGTIANNVVKDNKHDGIRLHNSGHVQVWNNTVARNGKEISITQDSRRQTDLSVAGHDPRQTLPDLTVPWTTTYNSLRNNVFDNGTGATILQVEDYARAQSGEQLHISTAHNAYAHSTATSTSRLVVWSAGGGLSPYVYASLSAFQNARGQEAGSVFSTSASTFPATSPLALPSTIAALVGQPSGALHTGAWR